MTLYLLLEENKPLPTVYTALRPLCEDYDIPYYGLTQLDKPILVKGVKYEIKQLTVKRIKGRGGRNRFETS